MKRSILSLLLFIAFLVFVSGETFAQSTKPQDAARPTSEQSLQELVSEVRQLRAAFQRINAAVYKGQVMLERLKLQQEQVARISRELTDVRETLSETRSQQIRMKELLGRVESRVEAGITDKSDASGLKAELETFSQREQRLATREAQLANELELERAKLNELNDRLNALDLELAPK